mmetsp:Transcript_16949/g.43812  ORF Transcript_16949/g.43812 Transcript_16949/m.43812 type:complete len:297 (+) Transcript_16949:1288-2178(+)
MATRTPRLITSCRSGRCTWPSRSRRATSPTSAACRYSATSDSMFFFTTSSGTDRDSVGAAMAVPSRSRFAASARIALATATASGASLTLSGGGSRMKVGVRQPSSAASARKCASIWSAVGVSSMRSVAVSRSAMNASKTCCEETMRRTWSEDMRTATISRSRSERSSERIIERRTSWSCCRGIRSSSSWRITSITSAESKYSRTRTFTFALNSSRVAGGWVYNGLVALNVVRCSFALRTSSGMGSGPLPSHATVYFVPFFAPEPALDADGSSSPSRGALPSSRNCARGIARPAIAV